MAIQGKSVVWLNFNPAAPPNGYWCYGWLEEVFSEFEWLYSMSDLKGDGAVIVIPAEYNAEYIDQINEALASLKWYTLILASDERGLFPVEELKLIPNYRLWVMTPHYEKHEFPTRTRALGELYPQDARAELAKNKDASLFRVYGCSFSGQITHQRRREMVAATERFAHLNQTDGFTKGLPRNEYYALLAQSRCVLAPSGPETFDSFRAYEALEAGAIPLLDTICPVEADGKKYWESIFGKNHPLPLIDNWNEAQNITRQIGFDWPMRGNLTFSWWQLYKRDLRNRLLQGMDVPEQEITILIPTSPIPSHPSLAILEETLASIRFHFPTADILIMCDGVREAQGGRRADYEHYVQEVCWKANFEWKNVYPIVFREHGHQANITRLALEYVETDLIMFVEHDTPLVTDEPFDWPNLLKLAQSDDIDVIRFHFEAHVHPEHEALMYDHSTVVICDVPVRRTTQWSQRPHIAKTDYYQRILRDHFPPSGRTMIEDKMHSVAQEFPKENRIAIYHPNEYNIKRSLHTDGRESDPKFDMVFE